MLTPIEVANLSYVDLLATLTESNRPPGGIDTIRRMISAGHLRPGIKVLHAGCNAGFFSRELVRRAGVQVAGIDINGAMVESATNRARMEGLDAYLRYCQADMRSLPFAQSTFDVVASAGALAFVNEDRELAISEWRRVTRPNGLLMNCEFFYARTPPANLLQRVSDILGVSVPCYDLNYWLDLFRHPRLESYYVHVGEQDLAVSDKAVEGYVANMVERHRQTLSKEARLSLQRRLHDTFVVFNENMRYLNYVIFVYVVRPPDFEPALYV
jgi:SAM-dependent methyltransferase